MVPITRYTAAVGRRSVGSWEWDANDQVVFSTVKSHICITNSSHRCERSFAFDTKKVYVEKAAIKVSSAPVGVGVGVERKEIESTQVSSGPTARVDRVQELSNTIHNSRVNNRVTTERSACFKHEGTLPAMLSKADKKTMLEEITPSVLNLDKKGKPAGVNAAVLLCKFMQCVLWDAGFRHTMLKFQFNALLAATGIDVKVLLDILLNLSAVKQPLLVCQNYKGQNMRQELCKASISFMDTKGLLLAGKNVLMYSYVYIGII
jgi:hypothetical protein